MFSSVENQNLQRTIFVFINKKHKNIYNIQNLNILFFSIIPFATASVVDKDYLSYQDVYDGLLNALFPIFFVILFRIDNSSTSKKKLLPILDDILYNVVTWLIPLAVTFSYDDMMGVKIFALVNMGLHVFYAAVGIIKHRTIRETRELDMYHYFVNCLFLTFFPVMVIPIFWIVYTTRQGLDSVSIGFIVLFSFLLFFLLFTFCLAIRYGISNIKTLLIYTIFVSFYGPNILQVLLIMLKWPINFYFVKLWLFILILSLTRNISYYTDEVPEDFLATSSTLVQWAISSLIKKKPDPSMPEKEDNITKNDSTVA